jgi:hypothetical protein
MNYGWKITQDLIDTGAEGTVGPYDITPELQARLDRGEGVRFMMYDDDGEHYYNGKLVLADASLEVVTPKDYPDFRRPVASGPLPEEAFGPLWDFGTPNAGATEIRYQGTGTDRRFATL